MRHCIGPVAIMVFAVCFVVFLALILPSNVSQHHQEFRDYCKAKGGVLFEKHNNFDCIIHGARISYYGD